MALSLTFVPAAVAQFVTGRVAEKETRVMRRLKEWYAPLLRKAIALRVVVAAMAAVLVVAAGRWSTSLGTEFLPDLDEGDRALTPHRTPGPSRTHDPPPHET